MPRSKKNCCCALDCSVCATESGSFTMTVTSAISISCVNTCRNTASSGGESFKITASTIPVGTSYSLAQVVSNPCAWRTTQSFSNGEGWDDRDCTDTSNGFGTGDEIGLTLVATISRQAGGGFNAGIGFGLGSLTTPYNLFNHSGTASGTNCFPLSTSLANSITTAASCTGAASQFVGYNGAVTITAGGGGGGFP